MKSIETVFKGTRYRSRTEARWALLFDLAEIAFQYEPEGYQLHNGWYVPDFWIPEWSCFFEVKPEGTIIAPGYYGDERSKAEDLAMETGHDVLFGCGSPALGMKLQRVPSEGISPKEEWLSDRISDDLVRRATAHRFDWKVGSFEPIGALSWRVLGQARRKMKE